MQAPRLHWLIGRMSAFAGHAAKGGLPLPFYSPPPPASWAPLCMTSEGWKVESAWILPAENLASSPGIKLRSWGELLFLIYLKNRYSAFPMPSTCPRGLTENNKCSVNF